MSSNQDDGQQKGQQNGPRLAPRPVSRPPVDDASRRTFSRPDGVDGSFVAEKLRPQKFRDGAEFAPANRPKDPVLAEAFGRPYRGGDSLQRHPVDADALEAEKLAAEVDEPDDPWRSRGHRAGRHRGSRSAGKARCA